MNIRLYEDRAFRLVDVLDYNGQSKADSHDFYREIIGCITNRIFKCSYGVKGAYVHMDFIQAPDGRWVSLPMHTSLILDIREEDDRVVIYTANSIYVLEPAEVQEPEPMDVAELIELWLENDGYQFVKGFYYDENKERHALRNFVHLGMFQDSCLIGLEENPSFTVCRYFPRFNAVEFYDTLYGQQDYSTPMLIHNAGDDALTIKFEFNPQEWTIAAGGELTVVPPARKRNR